MLRKSRKAWRALQQLGAPSLISYARYQFSVHSGLLALQTRTPSESEPCPLRAGLFAIPQPKALESSLTAGERADLFNAADEILGGTCRIFGDLPAPLTFTGAGTEHWTVYERRGTRDVCADLPGEDIKFLWEPARFAWAFTLGRAYHFSRDERYAAAFWTLTERFLDANPAYRGVHWLSAQEVALRLMALVFAWQVFHASPHSSPPRAARLGRAVAEHARRIPSSLAYARAQNNNHLISETAGLYTAALALPQHPLAPGWRKTGWQGFNAAVQTQITPDGVFIQHSANYQRLTLSEALWVARLAENAGDSLPQLTRQRLAAACAWLQKMMDPHRGNLPNWGHNDGAYVFPLTSRPFRDYRPLLQAAGETFLPLSARSAEAADEMSLWLRSRSALSAAPLPDCGPLVLRHPRQDSWAFLRCGRFSARPGHADQNHLDLWWRGINLARDPGTYLYNAPPPWNNALTAAHVHNTLTLNGADQMQAAGKFLYLDWAQGTVLDFAGEIAGEHDGYRRFGLLHRRRVIPLVHNGWQIRDELLPIQPDEDSGEVAVRLHWLLPDWNWEIQTEPSGVTIRIESPYGWVQLTVNSQRLHSVRPSVLRAGEVLSGSPELVPQPQILGWYSPVYGKKEPALSFSLEARGSGPCGFSTVWQFPEDKPN